jgi:HSP20 family protein
LWSQRRTQGGTTQTIWSPAIEVFQKEGNLVVRAELPGVNKDDVKIQLTDDGLVIQGERKEEHEEKREGFYRSERSYGQFYRLIPLPDDINPDQVRADFNNGVLEITVPVPQAQQRRKEIPIGAGGQSQAASAKQT